MGQIKGHCVLLHVMWISRVKEGVEEKGKHKKLKKEPKVETL